MGLACQNIYPATSNSIKFSVNFILKYALSLRSQGVSESRGILWSWRCLSGLCWVCRNGREAHLEGRQAPQASSAFRLEARFPARRREERGCGPVTGKDRASCQSGGERKSEVPASPRDEPLFHCDKPSRVPRGTANSTVSLNSQRHPGKFPKVPGRSRTPVFWPGESQGQSSLVGCCLWCRRVGHD